MNKIRAMKCDSLKNNQIGKCVHVEWEPVHTKQQQQKIAIPKDCIVNSTTIYSHLERLCKMHFKIIKGIIECINLNDDQTIATGAADFQTKIHKISIYTHKKWQEKQQHDQLSFSMPQHSDIETVQWKKKVPFFWYPRE